MAFKELLRKQRMSGEGVISSLASAAAESMDVRNQLFTKNSFLGSLFPRVKGYKAPGATSRTSPTSLMSSTGGGMSDAKLDIISQNTKISAKNSMMMPSMARDMNLMRQNIVKLVKLSGGKASTKADMFFLRAAERERAYESQVTGEKSPTRVETGGQSDGESKSPINAFLKGLLALLGVGMILYFTSPGFKNFIQSQFASFSGLISDVLEPFAGPESSMVLMFSNLAKQFGVLGKAVAPLARKLGLFGSALTLIQGKAEATDAERLREIKNSGGTLSPEEQTRLDDFNKKTDFSRQTEQLESMMEVSDEPSAAAKAIKKFFRFGVGAGNDALNAAPTPSSSIPTPMPPPVGMEAGRGTNRAPTPVDGISLLNSVMDKEGIVDESIRARIFKLAQVESSLNPNARGPVLQSGMHKGDQAHGILQIMPKTAPEVGFSADDIRDPEKAAIAGVRYFMKNLNRFDGNLDAATVAHHSGPGGAQKWLATGNAGTVDLATGLSTNNYLAKVQGQAEMVASSPRISGSSIMTASAQMNTGMMASSQQPIVINAPTNNVSNSTSGGGGGGMPAVVDVDFMRYLVGRMA
jgi:hypothetical protein